MPPTIADFEGAYVPTQEKIKIKDFREFGNFAAGGALVLIQEKKKKILGNSGERKWKAQTTALHPVFSLKLRFYSYVVVNSQKAMLNFYFKSRFSVKPSKFQTSKFQT